MLSNVVVYETVMHTWRVSHLYDDETHIQKEQAKVYNG